MRPLEGKVAVVTGASRGCGEGIALQLAEAGCTVYIAGRKPSISLSGDLSYLPTLAKTAEECRARGSECYEYYVDHSNMTEVEEFFEKISLKTGGKLDILINNAFSAVVVSDGIWDKINNVGLRNQYYCSIYGARMMVPHVSGLTVNVSSLGGQIYLFNIPYGAGKSAIDRMSVDMTHELGISGVTVVSLWPGAVRTELIINKLNCADDDWGKAANSMFMHGESIEYAGKGVVCVASDPDCHKRNGKILISTDLGDYYNFKDIDDRVPVNIRSLKELLYLCGYQEIGKWVPEFVKVLGWLIKLFQNKIS